MNPITKFFDVLWRMSKLVSDKVESACDLEPDITMMEKHPEYRRIVDDAVDWMRKNRNTETTVMLGYDEYRITLDPS